MSNSRSAIVRAGRPKKAAAGAGGAVRASQVKGRPLVPRRTVATAESLIEAARREAQTLLAAARAQATALRQAAQQEIAQAMESGRQRGQREGYRAGQAQAQEEMTAALTLIRSAARDTKALRDAILLNSERQILRLLTAATRRIVGDIMEQHPDLVVRAAQEALRRAGDQRVLRLRVHPDSAAILEARYGPEEQNWEIRADSALAVGGCIVDTEAGVIDASIEGQIAEIQAAWEEVA